jgi:hypothetical protein
VALLAVDEMRATRGAAGGCWWESNSAWCRLCDFD